MTAAFDPYHLWLGIAPAEQPPNHYRLLGIGLFEADADVIEGAADRQMAHIQRHQLGQYAAQSQKLLNELSAAKLCLLKADRKEHYDRALRKQLAAKAAPPPPAPVAPAVIARHQSPAELAPPDDPAADADDVATISELPQHERRPVGKRRAAVSQNIETRKTAARKSGTQGPGSNAMIFGGAIAAGVAVMAIVAIVASRDKPQQNVAAKPPEQSGTQTTVPEKKSPKPKSAPEPKPAPEVEPSASNEPDSTPQPAAADSPAAPPESGDAEANVLATGNVIDLLPLVKTGPKSAVGKWQRSKKSLTLLATKGAPPRITVPFAPPNEYQLELVVEPQPGAELVVGLVAGGRQLAAILDGWGGSTSGLEQIESQPGDSNASTHQGRVLHPRQLNVVLVSVRGDAIRVACDGTTVIDWHGPFDRLNLPSGQGVADQRALFLGGGSGTALRIRSLRLATLSGKGQELTEPLVAQPNLARVEPATEPDLDPPLDLPAAQPPGSMQPPANAQPPATPEAIAKRPPVPSKDEVDEAAKLIREVFADDFKQAKKHADKLALAEKLLKQASESQTEPERYALLSEARVLAAAGGSPSLAIQVIDETGKRFDIDTAHEIADLIDQLAKESLPPAVRKELAETLLPIADEAVARSDYDTARRLLAAATQSAHKTNDSALVKQIAARVQEVGDAKKLFDAYRKALDKIAENPDDPPANLAAGKYLCFVKQDWEQGLAHLAKGSDPAFKEIAELELQAPSSPEDQVKLADLWWAMQEGAKGKEKTDYAERCEKWYSAAQPGLKGLSQTKVSKRLEELAALTKAAGSSVASGGGRPAAGSGGTTTVSKTISARFKAAVKKENLARSQVAGGGVGTAYSEMPPAGVILAGLNVTFRGPNSWLTSVQALYWGPRGIVPGETAGNPSGPPATLVAKKGYAVSGIRVSASYDIWGIQLIFAKLTDKGLNLSDTYTSEWIGGQSNAGLERTVGDKSTQPAVGIFGTGNNQGVTGVGLIQLPTE